MRRLGFWLLVVALVLVQVGLVPALRPLGVVPNVLLGLVTLVGLFGAASSALVVAVGGGLLLDLASGANFGLWTGCLILVALVSSLIQRAGVETSVLFVPLAVVLGGTVVAAAVIWVGLVATVSDWPWAQLLGRLALEVVLNLGLMMALRPLVRRLVRE